MKNVYFNKKLNSIFSGFTLIELLIVVTIISILAAIAVPNFLEAQVRSKVSRASADMRTIAIALESYHIDNKAYPQAAAMLPVFRLFPLTTPVSYVSQLPLDPFKYNNFITPYNYGAMDLTNASRWILASLGPDLNPNTDPIEFYPGYQPGLFYGQVTNYDYMTYDPTNGTLSRGDIYRASDFVQQ